MNSKSISLSQRLKNANNTNINNNMDATYYIDSFKAKYSIKEVIERCTGITIAKKNFPCVLHNGDNKEGSSIDKARGIYTCWTRDCTNHKGVNQWDFIALYYKLDRTNFKEVAKKINEVFGENIPIINKAKEIKPLGEIKPYETINIHNRVSEVSKELRKYDNLLLNAKTGTGKSYFALDKEKGFALGNEFDYIIFLVYNRTIANQVAETYDMKIIEENETRLPDRGRLSATIKKAPMILREMERLNEERSLLNMLPISYALILDECHELITKNNLLSQYDKQSVKALVRNADKFLGMSANTNDFYNCFKDEDIFNKYIKVEPYKVINNLNTMNIVRLEGKQNSKNKYVIDTIIDNVVNYSKILVQEDNKTKLEEYKKELETQGYNCIVLNADNKEYTEVAKEFDSIIKNSRLNNTIVLCTSVINAGININNENVLSIMIQNRLQFDTNKIIQFFGRVRTNKKNEGILILDYKQVENMYVNNRDNIYERNLEVCIGLINRFNLDLLNTYGLDIDINKVKRTYGVDKDNDGYYGYSNCLYLDDNTKSFKIDSIALYEKSRNEWERSNYYKPNFILDVLKKDIKANEFTFRMCELEDIESDAQEEKESFKDAIESVLSSEDSVNNILSYVKKDIKHEDIKNDDIFQFIKDFKSDTTFKSFRKDSYNILTKIEDLSTENELEVFKLIVKAYSEKETKKLIQNIKRVKIYNVLYPIGVKPISRDIIYDVIRTNMDCFINSGHSILDCKSLMPSILNDYRKEVNGERVEVIKKTKKGEKMYKCIKLRDGKLIKLDKIKKDVQLTTKDIYRVTDKGFIKSLNF